MVVKITNRSTLTKVCRSIGPIYYVCKLVGLSPVHVRVQNGSIILTPGKRDWLYFLAYITMYSTLSAYALWCVITDEHNYNIIPQIVVIVECYVMIALKFLTIFFGFLLRKLVTDCLHMLAQIDANFSSINVTLDYNEMFKRSFLIFVVMCTSVTVRSILMMTTVDIDIAQQSTLFIAALVKSLSKYQFIVLIMIVSKRFAIINSSIKSFYKKNTNGNNMILVKYFTNLDKVAEKLYVLCRLHYKLCNITRILNRAFAWQLLISLGVSLSDILFQSYYLYVSFSGRVKDIPPNNIMCAVTWVLDEILEIYLLVYACASTCENANKTSVILHELRNNCKSSKLEGHIQMYSLQMLHQKIEFSALGFFVMDYSLIYSIIGAVTTYLVIFIQFDQSQINMPTTSPTFEMDSFNSTHG